MADVNASIGVNIDTSSALGQLKSLQRQISQFHTSISRSSEAAALAQRDLQRNLLNSINSIGAFSAELRTVKTTAESFTDSLQRNKFSMREYFRFAGASSKTFGKLFKSEFETINKVAEDNVKRLQTQYIKLGRDSTGAMRAIAVMPKELDLTDYSVSAQIAAQRQALFNQLVKQGSTNLLNFGKNTQWAGRQLMVGFTIPLIALGSAASKTFMEMEAQVIKFRKVYGDLFTPAAERQQALEDITALGEMFTKYGIAVADTVGLAAEAAAAGFQGVDLQRQTTEATRLQVLGQIDAQKALETTISLQNAFQLQSEELADAINFLNAVENQTVVSLDDITTAIPKAAPVVKQLGGDVKDLAFFLSAMKEGGVNASEGANALKSGLASLINPTDKAKEMMKGFGIDIDTIVNKNAGNVKQTVIEFAQALDQLSNLNRQRAIEQLFGKFQLARLSTLFENVTKTGNQASRVLDLATASTEDLAAMAEQELGMTAESSMNKFRKAVENLQLALVPVGQAFLEAITPIIEFVGGILEKFSNLSSGVKKAITIITIAVGGIAPVLLMTFGLLANFLANAVKGAMILRNGYLRLTGQSQILSEQTQYLNIEQQNAAAVAHSLDQSHANLTQTFNVEREALVRLIDTYKSGVGALRAFATTNPGMMMRPRGYNNGVFMVPGSGNRDTVPAMLTPGEAVIPKEMAKKYGPLIQGIIADNIPGYNDGISAVESSISSTMRSDFAHITSRTIVTIQQFLDSLNALPQAMRQARSGLIAKLTEIRDAFGEDLEVNTYSGLGFTQRKDFNIAMGRGQAVPAQEFLQDFQQQGVQKWSTTLKVGGTRLEDVSQELLDYDAALQAGVQRMLDLNGDATITSEQFAALEREIRNTLPATSALRQALDLAEATITEYRINLNNAMAIEAGFEPYRVPSTRDPSRMSSKPWIDLPTGRSIRIGGEHDTSRTMGGYGMFPAGTQAIDSAVLSMQDAAQTRSPSERTIPIGEDLVRGVQVGMERQSDRLILTGKTVAEDAVAGLDFAPSLLGPGGRPLRSPFNINPALLGPKGEELISPSVSAKPALKESQIAEQISVSKETIEVGQKQIDTMKDSNARLSKMNGAMMSATFAVSALSSITSLFADGPLASFSGVIAKITGAMFALMSITQLLTQTKALELLQSRATLATAAVKMARGGGGLAPMAGLVGKSGLFGSLARAGLAVSKFLGPWGKVTALIGLTIIAIKASNAWREKERRAIEAVSDAMNITAEKTKVLGDFFGVVPNKLPSQMAGNLLVTGAKQRTEIESLKADEGFQKQFKDTIDNLRSASIEEAQLAFQNIGMTLSAQGFAAEQINTIVKALKEESGKTAVQFDFTKFKFADFEKNISTAIQGFEKSFATGYSEVTRSAISRATGEITTWTESTMSKDLKRNISTLGTSLGNAIDAVSGQMRNGIITSEQYTERMAKINSKFNMLDETSKKLLLAIIFKNFDKETQKALGGLSSLGADMQMLAVQALAAGVAMTGFMRTLTLLSESKKAINANTDPREVAAFNRALGKTESDLTKAINKTTKATEAANKAEQDRQDAGGEGKYNLIKELQKNIEAINQQRKAFVEMRKAGIEAATASEIAANPEMAKALVAAAEAGGNAWNEATKKIKEYTAAQKLLERTLIASGQSGDYELARLEMAQKYVDLQEHLIDMQNSAELKSYNDRLEEQSLLLEDVNRKIEKITESGIAPIEKQIRANNYALEEISAQEDEINDKYDQQFETLDKIKSINQDINKIQQQRISIADALTRGDISEAAQLISQAKQDRASSAEDSVRSNLEEQRRFRIESLGREAIEKRNKDLQLQITRIKRDQIDILENEKEKIESNIDSIQYQINNLERFIIKQKESMFVFGMTKLQIDNAAKALDLAKNAGIDINDENFLNNVLKAAAGDATSLSTALVTVATNAKNALTDLEKLRAKQIGGTTATVTQDTDFTPTVKREETTAGGGTAAAETEVASITVTATPTITKEDIIDALGLFSIIDQNLLSLAGLGTTATTSATVTTSTSKGGAPSGGGGGNMLFMANGGMVVPKYFANGALARGTDTIPAMLSPGEFVVSKYATKDFGLNNLRKINDGSYDGGAVYNYNLSVNVKSDANPNDIARTVISQIKQIDSQRIRNQR